MLVFLGTVVGAISGICSSATAGTARATADDARTDRQVELNDVLDPDGDAALELITSDTHRFCPDLLAEPPSRAA